MTHQEINFDGIVGPSHNYAGLSLGNIASASHKGDPSYPRAAALQGVAKMRGNLARLEVQGFLLPLPRPNTALAQHLTLDETAPPQLLAATWSASSMWTANAATVSPAADTRDGKCHLTPANLVTMLHRAQEWPDTKRMLEVAFGNSDHFTVHDIAPQTFGDEGAANHMRLCEGHANEGVEVFVYGRQGGKFPARQHEQASRLVARAHGLDPAKCVFIEQNPAAIEAGAEDVESTEDGHVIWCADTDLNDVSTALEGELGESESTKLVWKPTTTTEMDLEGMEKLMKLVDALEDDDDVQRVTTNFEASDEVMDQL